MLGTASFLMMSIPMTALAEETAYVTATSLNIRKAPDVTADTVGRFYRGDMVTRTGNEGDWSRVLYQGKEYYVASQYLTSEKKGASAEGTERILLNPDWKYAGFSKINTGQAVLYRSEGISRKNKVVCVNAGHGTKGGAGVKTQCHPDGSPKVTGGTTGAGAVTAVAVSGGMTFADGTPEAQVTLSMAKLLKQELLSRGYDVLMIRETEDVQLDNLARTVIANNRADCHIALHWDSTSKDKGAFYMSVPETASYRNMEPVASMWQQHHKLGDALVHGLRNGGVKIFSSGSMAMDLTQTSYSTIPSVDIELGDKASDHSETNLGNLAKALADGVDGFFGF